MSKHFIILLALILVFQPVAAAFADCMQMNKPDDSVYGEMNQSHMMHHSAMNKFDNNDKHNSCCTDCDCAGKCLHACSTVFIDIALENLFVFEKNQSEFSVTHNLYHTGYKLLLLRPPSHIS